MPRDEDPFPGRMSATDPGRRFDPDLLGVWLEPACDRLTALACDLLSAPSGGVSFIDDHANREYVKSAWGLPGNLAGNLAAGREIPLPSSLCRIVRTTDACLSITDFPQDARFSKHPAQDVLGIVAYLGQPVHLPCGTPAGAIWVFDAVPRVWSEADKQRLRLLADSVDEAIRGIAAAQAAALAQRTMARALGARELFLAGLNHEIRTALNGVLGAVSVLGDLPLDDEIRPLISMIDQSGTDLHHLLDTLLSRTDAATLKGPDDPQRGLREILTEVFGVLRFTRLGHAHRFTLEVTGEEDRIGGAEARRFKQFAYDLLGSAIIAAPSGSTDLRVTATRDMALLHATLNADPATDGDLRAALGDPEFGRFCSLGFRSLGSFDILALEPQRAVIEIRLSFGPQAPLSRAPRPGP